MKFLRYLSLFAAVGFASQAQALDIRSSEDVSIRATLNFAECMTPRNRAYVVRFLEATPGSRQERQIASRLTDRGAQCLVRVAPADLGDGLLMLRMTPRLMRGGFAEALFKNDFSSPGTSLRQPAQVAAFRIEDISRASHNDEGETSARVAIILIGIGECVAQGNPALVDRLLRTEPASVEERRAMEPLVPVVGSCFPEGEQFTINRPMLRGFLAEGLYRYSARLASEGGAN